MRKITAGLFITLNGVVEAPETWNPPYYDELNVAVMPRPTDAGIHRYGRRSYELFRFLLAERLLDELILLVHPVVTGVSRRLFG